jgi:hypothetical protein
MLTPLPCSCVVPCPQSGAITAPPRGQLFYLSQRPYLVTGTLRDQLLYPRPPAAVWAATAPAEQEEYSAVAGAPPQVVGQEAGEAEAGLVWRTGCGEICCVQAGVLW